MINELSTIYQTAQDGIEHAIKQCLKFKHGIDPQSLKKDKSWVTAADQSIERFLRSFIAQRYPNHHILGEEEGGSISTNENDYTWILDPIDGTFSFIHNIPFYSSLIAVLKGGVPIIGVAALPALNIVMSAQINQGVLINGEVYKKSPLVGSSHIDIVATADPYRFYIEKKQSVLQYLYGENCKSRTYPDALGYYLLLKGSVRAFVDPKVEIWDVAPFHVIMREAGFHISDWNGNETLKKGTSFCVPCDEQKMPINSLDLIEILKTLT